MSDLNKAILHTLCNERDFNKVKSFLELHQNLLNEAPSPMTDLTLLMYGCLHEWSELVEYLISNYLNTLKVNIKTKYGDTALYWAVMREKIDFVRLLLTIPNIDVKIPCGMFDKPVLWYCKSRECYDLLSPYYTTLNEYEKKMAWLYILMSSYEVDVEEVKDIMTAIPLESLQRMKDDISMMVVLAAGRGKTKILEYLLSFYGDIIDINKQDQNGNTSLFQAIESRNADCVKLLLVSPNINVDQSQLSEALYKAVTSLKTEILKVLLDHSNLNVNERFSSGVTALWFAVHAGRVDCVKLLLAHRDIDVNINCEDEFGKPVLWYCKNRECYELLLPYYTTINEYEKKMAWLYSLCLSANGDVEEVKRLGADLPTDNHQQMKDDMSKLIMALVVRKDTQIIKYLLSSCGDRININIKNKFGNTILHQAVLYGGDEIMQLCLSHPDINVDIQTGEFDKPVLWYCQSRECYDLLLPYYTLNEYEKEMAWLCSWMSNGPVDVEEVKGKMEKMPFEALHQIKDDVSVMALIAAGKGKAEILEYLLSSYSDIIDINRQDKAGRSSLHRAFLYNRDNCVNILINNKVDVGLRDKDGKTFFELKQYKLQMTSMRTKMNIFSLIFNEPKAKWNRFKIMLVGQGRAGKTALANNLAGKWKGETPSTIGAEQMDMQLFYGEVDGGKLAEYERPKLEFEAFLVDQSFPDSESRMKKDSSTCDNTSRSSQPSKNVEAIEPSSLDRSISQNEATSPTKKESSSASRFKRQDYKIDFEAVDSHCRTLQEVNTASSYKLILVDFGGQSIFNVLHAFFMSKQGIYLVAFDMELFLSKDEGERESCCKELKFWLNSITMYTSVGTEKTAPVAIVGTRGDKVRKKKYHRRISKKLEDLFGEMKVWQSLIGYTSGDEQLHFFPNDNTKTESNTVSQQLMSSIEQSLVKSEWDKEEIDILWINIFDEMKASQQSYLLFEDVVNIAQQKLAMRERAEELKVIKKEVREMLRFLNDIGMLMWIEEGGLDDVIILDPIEYLVKPVTTIICKHLATKDDPYMTRHEIPEIHGEMKNKHNGDWMRMLEYGFVSETLITHLLERFYEVQPSYNQNMLIRLHQGQVVNLMMKYGLMVKLSSMYFIPSLVPPDPSNISRSSNFPLPDSFVSHLCTRQDIISLPLSKSLKFSLFFYLSFADGLAKCFSATELQRKGFLPYGLFERLVGPFTQSLIAKIQSQETSNQRIDKILRENKLIIGLKDQIQLTYNHHKLRLINRLEGNRIDVEMELHDDVDMTEEEKKEERVMILKIYDDIIKIVERLLLVYDSSLETMTLIPVPTQQTADIVSIKILKKEDVEIFFPLTEVRSMLDLPDRSHAERETHDYVSGDAKCWISLRAKEMKKDPYWSVWRENMKIPMIPLNSSSPLLPLTAGKKTHVFLSHDWGIDGNNHNRVKQVSEALKSRGLITWIDDERIVNEIDEKIVDGLYHTECMLVFVTENYMKKLDSGNHLDYCKREFNYGFEELGREKVFLVVLDESMKDRTRWSRLLKFNFSSALYSDLSEIFKQPSNTSEDFAKEKMNELHKKIIAVLGLENVVEQESNEAVDLTRRKSTGKGELSSDEIVVDCDEGVLSSNNNFNNEKRKKKNKKRKRDELSSDEEEVNHDQSEENNIKKKKKRKNQNDSSLEVKNEQNQMTGYILKSNQSKYDSSNSSKKRRKKRRRLRVRLQCN